MQKFFKIIEIDVSNRRKIAIFYSCLIIVKDLQL